LTVPNVPETLKDEVRDLIANGWTPPDRVLGEYRYLLRPFAEAKGYKLYGDTLDDWDRKNLIALLAVFDHFGIPLPQAPANDDEVAA
jgi:hypothetical protein